MEAFFRSVAIGLGVLMGTLNPGVEPDLQLVVHRTGGQLVASGTVVRAVSRPMEEALSEGVPMALTLRVVLDGRPTSATQTLVYRPLSQEWLVSGPCEGRTYFTRDQAITAWVTWKDLAVGAIPMGPFVIDAEVVLTFPGRPEWRSDMVWTTPSAPWKRSYGLASEVPY